MRNATRTIIAVTGILLPVSAWAATTGMPWETPLEQVTSSLTGPVVTSIAAIAVALTGVLFALAPQGGFARQAAGIGLGLSIAVAAPSFINTLFGGAAGAELGIEDASDFADPRASSQR